MFRFDEKKQAFLKSPEARAEFADAISKNIAVEIMVEWSGLPVYIRRFSERKDDKILEEFTGTNYKPLAIKWALAEHSVRRIIARSVRRKREKKQGTLMDEKLIK